MSGTQILVTHLPDPDLMSFLLSSLFLLSYLELIEHMG